MLLDTASLRVSFAVVALTLLALSYFVAYRSTRSAYCGWWCTALGLFLVGSACYLLDGTVHQVWANPLGNVVMVTGAWCVWAGTRAIRARPVRAGVLLGGVGATAVASALDDPSENVWAGAPVFLGMMALMIGLASLELWRAIPRDSAASLRARDHAPILRAMSGMSGALSFYYLLRTIAFVAVGADGRLFAVYLGSDTTTLITTVMLATVSFSTTALSHVDVTIDLRTRATHDGLTGLLNRTEFLRQVGTRWRRSRRGSTHGAVILADLDHFKSINDRLGHSAGDFALQTFAAACRGAVRSTDLIGRYGGEEFVIFLEQAPADRARDVVEEISRRLRATPLPDGMALPTVSYGVAHAEHGVPLAAAIERADQALYEAKTLGRDRVVVVDVAATT